MSRFLLRRPLFASSSSPNSEFNSARLSSPFYWLASSLPATPSSESNNETSPDILSARVDDNNPLLGLA
jgi:hypothetical protein